MPWQGWGEAPSSSPSPTLPAALQVFPPGHAGRLLSPWGTEGKDSLRLEGFSSSSWLLASDGATAVRVCVCVRVSVCLRVCPCASYGCESPQASSSHPFPPVAMATPKEQASSSETRAAGWAPQGVKRCRVCPDRQTDALAPTSALVPSVSLSSSCEVFLSLQGHQSLRCPRAPHRILLFGSLFLPVSSLLAW